MSDQNPTWWDHLRRGMADVGAAVPLPILSPLLQAPERVHEENQFQNMQNAMDQTGPNGSPPPHLLYPSIPPPAVRVPGGVSAKPGQGQSLLTGQPMAGAPAKVDPSLPVNFQPGDPLPEPSEPVAQGPPEMRGKLPMSTAKFRKKFLDSFNSENMKYLDPKQKQEIFALKGMGDLHDGNWMGAADQMVRAGMSAPQAIAFSQNFKGRQELADFQKNLVEGFNPANGSEIPHASQENFLRTGMTKALKIKDPKTRIEAVKMVTGIAHTLPKQAQIDQEMAHHLAGSVNDWAQTLTDKMSPAQARKSMLNALQGLPKNVLPYIQKNYQSVLNEWMTGRRVAMEQQRLNKNGGVTSDKLEPSRRLWQARYDTYVAGLKKDPAFALGDRQPPSFSDWLSSQDPALADKLRAANMMPPGITSGTNSQSSAPDYVFVPGQGIQKYQGTR